MYIVVVVYLPKVGAKQHARGGISLVLGGGEFREGRTDEYYGAGECFETLVYAVKVSMMM
jgi:hypothetical protein